MAETMSATVAKKGSGEAEVGVAELPRAGATEAAILLMALGEDEAAKVLRFMKPEEVQRLGTAMGEINGVSQQAIGSTLERFADRIGGESSLGMDSGDYFRSTLERAIGHDRATNVLSTLTPAREQWVPPSLGWMHTKSIVRSLHGEHPQLIATVLGLLPGKRAGEVLAALPAEQQADLVRRVTRLDAVHPGALSELDEILRTVLTRDAEVELSGLGGKQAASEMLNAVGKDAETRILEAIDEADEELANELRDGMFIFENLLALDHRSMQTLLRDVSNEDLILALKGASEELKVKIFANMSSRAAELLADDLAAKGPVRLSEVETAQRSILDVAKRLDEDGQIQLGTSGEQLV